MLTIAEIKTAVETIAPEYPIKQVQLFGSYAEGLATPESDVDVLVEFNARPITLLDYCGFQEELSEFLNVQVDIVQMPLSKYAKTNLIINEVVRLYG